MDNKRKPRRIKKLWENNPYCYFCGVKTIIFNFDGKTRIIPDIMACLYHLRSRYTPNRLEPNPKSEERTVLACNKCCNLRSQEETSKIPVGILQELSKH